MVHEIKRRAKQKFKFIAKYRRIETVPIAFLQESVGREAISWRIIVDLLTLNDVLAVAKPILRQRPAPF